uniref:Barrier-to-autointegration factor 1 n=1 Tax=Trichuris muris TaxID=70415 RepID=A0A5S6QK79_TRIMR
MATTASYKHSDFISEPMGDKDVDCVPGIGENYAKKLRKEGFDKAYLLLGQFLILKQSEDLFVTWIVDLGGLSRKHAEQCARALTDWVSHNL